MMRLLSTTSAAAVVLLVLSSRPVRSLTILFCGLQTDQMMNVHLRIVYGQDKISDELLRSLSTLLLRSDLYSQACTRLPIDAKSDLCVILMIVCRLDFFELRRGLDNIPRNREIVPILREMVPTPQSLTEMLILRFLFYQGEV
jgi:hypothetical protein